MCKNDPEWVPDKVRWPFLWGPHQALRRRCGVRKINLRALERNFFFRGRCSGAPLFRTSTLSPWRWTFSFSSIHFCFTFLEYNTGGRVIYHRILFLSFVTPNPVDRDGDSEFTSKYCIRDAIRPGNCDVFTKRIDDSTTTCAEAGILICFVL